MNIFENTILLKERIKISFKTGFLISLFCLILLFLNGFSVTKFNIIEAIQTPIYLLLIFIFISSLFFTLITLYVLAKHGYKNTLIIQIVIPLIIVVGMGKSLYDTTQKSNFYNTLAQPDLTEGHFDKLYRKALKEENILALERLAENSRLPDSLEKKLSFSKYESVKIVIVWKTDSEEILARLAFDELAEVRAAVARNKLTPLEILDSLQYDKNEEVKNTAFSMFQARRLKLGIFREQNVNLDP